MLTIGLFGTCGNSKWRDPFIKKYKELDIQYFNPKVDIWNEELAKVEAQHLAEDKIILLPIINETYGFGSLSEVGFLILNAIRLDDRRDFVVMIQQSLIEKLDNEVARKESLRARALVSEHLKKLSLNNLYIVNSFDEMLEISIKLYESAKILYPLEKYNPHN